MRHFDHFVREGVDACRANESGPLGRCADSALPDKSLCDGAVHAIDGHERVPPPGQEERDLEHLES